jgi:23S rRNA (adenine-N6)-dimethyltransferase
MLSVDLGAGKGIITDEILNIVGGRILVIEKDPRLVAFLTTKYRHNRQVEVRAGDILDVALPKEPFVIAANIPFNVSTQLVRRWMTLSNFHQAALLVEREFGRRLAGEYGLTKLSASLGAIFKITVQMRIASAQFHPQPRANIALMQVARHDVALISLRQVERYWAFVNYLFERSRYLIGEALPPFSLALPAGIGKMPLAEASLSVVVNIFEDAVRTARQDFWRHVDDFNRKLPPNRRPLSGTLPRTLDPKTNSGRPGPGTVTEPESAPRRRHELPSARGAAATQLPRQRGNATQGTASTEDECIPRRS